MARQLELDMGSSIYTRKGDAGQTSLANGERVSKSSARVESYGTIDECNSWVGAARSIVMDSYLDSILEFFQHRLFNCSSNLATPEESDNQPVQISREDIEFLEGAIDSFEEKTGSLNRFILPGGTKEASFLHIARTVCRRAERKIVFLSMEEKVDPRVQKFINRGSDFLFAAARYANFIQGRSDVYWENGKERPSLKKEATD